MQFHVRDLQRFCKVNTCAPRKHLRPRPRAGHRRTGGALARSAPDSALRAAARAIERRKPRGVQFAAASTLTAWAAFLSPLILGRSLWQGRWTFRRG